MDNQKENTNGMNLNQSLNSSSSNANNESNGITTSNTMENVVPVRPSLDAILNGNSMENISAQPEKTLNSTPTLNTINQELNSIPTIETIPEEPIVDTNVSSNPSAIEELPSSSLQNQNVIGAPTEILGGEEDDSSIIESTQMPVMESIENSNVSIEPPIDDFNEVPVPPVFEGDNKNKKEKNGSKLLIIFLLIILIAAVGFGVYYFLTLAKNSATTSITLKEVKLELGSTLSNNIEDYAVLNGYNKNDCSLNLGTVNINKVSTYKYTVTCGKIVEEGTIIVDDTTKPEVITNDLTLLPNATVKADDFIESCADASKCSYEFLKDITDIKSTIGEHEVEIVVSDEYNNKTTVKAKLTIASNAPVKYLTCKKNAVTLNDINASLVDSYRIGIDANDNFFNAVRTAEFTFNTINDFNKVKDNYNEQIGINSITGNMLTYETNRKIFLKANKTIEDMNRDLNGRLPNSAIVLRAYLSGLGYTCN